MRVPTKYFFFLFLSCALLSGCVIKRPARARAPAPKRPAVSPAVSPAPPKTQPTEIDLVPLVVASSEGRKGALPVRGLAQRHPVKRKKILFSKHCAQAGEDPLWFCMNDRWLAGENRGKEIEIPNKDTKHIIDGVDLGISIQFGPEDRTYFYMGDTMGKPTRSGCGFSKPDRFCNDAILVSGGPKEQDLRVDRRPDDGVATSVVVRRDKSGKIDGFLPMIIDGINGRDPLPLCKDLKKKSRAPCLAPFNVPTGAATVQIPSKLLPKSQRVEQGSVESVLVWYATAGATYITAARDPSKHYTRGASWLVSSTDGLHFEKIMDKPFSRDKFIQISPVFIPNKKLKKMCERDKTSPLCDRAIGSDGDIVLLVGTGEKYRKSPLYLGVLRLSDLAVLYYHLDVGTGRESWSRSEAKASPIIGKSAKHKRPKLGRKKKWGRPDELFGELSVKLVEKDACPKDLRGRCEDTLVLLATQGGSVRYRTAPLSHPGAIARPSSKARAWSKSIRTSATGYGPYIIDMYTSVERSKDSGFELRMYHVISGWCGRDLGKKDHNPYGVFSRPLVFVDEASCKKDRHGMTTCDVTMPPWPPAGL